MRIALTGKMGRGKSTVSTYLCENYGFTRIGFADKLKAIVGELRPDLFENGKKPRQVLQRVGQLLKDELGQTIWQDYVFAQIDNDVENNTLGDVVIDDARFVFEATGLRIYGFTIIKIDGPNQRNEHDDMLYGHHLSELECDKIQPNYTIQNKGTLGELYYDVDTLIELLKSKQKC